MRLLICLVSCFLIGAGSAVAKECRIPDAAPGVRVQLPPGCQPEARPNRSRTDKQDDVRADAGFIDLGNGTKVRVGGRVRAEVGVQR